MTNTGEVVSQTVRALLADAVSEDRASLLAGKTVNQIYSMRLKDLAHRLGVTEAYMPRKIQAGAWTIRDLDVLAEYFGVYPADLVPGPSDENSE